MAGKADFQIPRIGTGEKAKIRSAIEQALKWHSGKWHVQLIGDSPNDVWEMRVSGPGTEASEFLLDHDPEAIVAVLRKVTSAQ